MTKAIILNEEGEKLGPNQTGEICLLPEVPFCGYYEDPETTRESLTNGKFLKTGDIGYFDDDCYLYLVGRKKEQLKVNRFHVEPSEIEDLINSMDGVQNSCVVGVLDEATGNDIVCAFVIRTPALNGEIPQINEQSIHDHINTKVIDAKKIRGGIFFVESFPLTPSGKVKKHELKKNAKEKLLSN